MVQLWTERHRPSSSSGIAGNRKAVEEVRGFIRSFERGKGLLLAGPPGVGKSLIAEAVSLEEGLHLVEINASDERGKAEVEAYMSASKTQPLFSKGRVILLEEVDGLSGGDRGASQAMAELVKASFFPVILTANDLWSPRLRQLKSHCRVVKLSKVPAPSIEKFLRGICEKEGIEARGSVLKSLARFSEGDLRAAITDLQMASLGKKSLDDGDLEAIGYREKELQIFNILPTVFRSGRIASARRSIQDSDKDPDEVLWWVENNLHLEFEKEKLAGVFDAISRADIFRGLVMKQQNWAFKGYMADMIAGVTVHGRPGFRYVPYRPPDRFLQLARSKARRAEMDELCGRLGKEFHCSKKAVRRDFLPYLRIILEAGNSLGMGKEDIETITA